MSGNSRATRSWAVLAAAPVSMGSGAGGGVVVVFLADFGGGIFNMSEKKKKNVKKPAIMCYQQINQQTCLNSLKTVCF